MKNAIYLLFLFVPILLAVSPLTNIKNTYDRIQTIQGNFTQTICSPNDGTCQQFEGKFYIKRPNLSRLEVNKPEKQILITDSSNLYIYLVNPKKLYIQSANSGINFFAIFDLLLNDTFNFQLTAIKNNLLQFELQKDSLQPVTENFRNLKFLCNTKTNLIEKFSYLDNSEREVEFALSKIKVNENIPQKLFKLTIPKDVKVFK
ncbi:MAG: outer membrane lipoprotein chaperone LolA [candidate division WOR-3 bacterium]|nr:outer membrane lipoprotein chaperone LolA [candidate division WOR-3 bacterium]